VRSHLKHECEIQAMINHMKDLKFILQEKRNWLHGQVNVVDEAFVPKDEFNAKEEAKDFVDLGNNIEACTIELQFNKKLGVVNEQNYLTLIVTNVLAICSIKFNLVESALLLPSLWYLDFGATHHVNNNLGIFFNMQHMNDISLCSTSGFEKWFSAKLLYQRTCCFC